MVCCPFHSHTEPSLTLITVLLFPPERVGGGRKRGVDDIHLQNLCFWWLTEQWAFHMLNFRVFKLLKQQNLQNFVCYFWISRLELFGWLSPSSLLIPPPPESLLPVVTFSRAPWASKVDTKRRTTNTYGMLKSCNTVERSCEGRSKGVWRKTSMFSQSLSNVATLFHLVGGQRANKIKENCLILVWNHYHWMISVFKIQEILSSYIAKAVQNCQTSFVSPRINAV